MEAVPRAPFVAGSHSKCSSPGEGSDLSRLLLSQAAAVAGADWDWGRFSRELEISKDWCSGKQGPAGIGFSKAEMHFEKIAQNSNSCGLCGGQEN